LGLLSQASKAKEVENTKEVGLRDGRPKEPSAYPVCSLTSTSPIPEMVDTEFAIYRHHHHHTPDQLGWRRNMYDGLSQRLAR
jgi:hypothetical protein